METDRATSNYVIFKGLPNNLIFKVVTLFYLSPEKGTKSSIYLATSDEVEGITGQFYETKKKLEKVLLKENENIVWEFCQEISVPYMGNIIEQGNKEDLICRIRK